MTISESQLQRWRHQGAVTTSSATYNSIRTALDRYDEWPPGVRWECYLQGSYRNSTNIRGDSDVDVVVQCNSTFLPSLDLLTADEREQYRRWAHSASYGYADFRKDTQRALEEYYGVWSVDEGRIALRVDSDASRNRLAADVVPCLQYRDFFKFTNGGEHDFVEGMAFLVDNNWRVNYPKWHYDNGVHKQSDTGNRFKSTVRMFKNARERYNDDLGGLEAPSYFVENLIHLVPDELFHDALQVTYLDLVLWLYDNLRREDAGELRCQNGLMNLFGDRPEQWSLRAGRKFVDAMLELWEGE